MPDRDDITIRERDKTIEKLQAENDRLHLAHMVTTAALRAGVPYPALEDVTARVEEAFSLKGGKMTAYGGHHTVEDFIDALKTTAGHLFESSPEAPRPPSAAPHSRSKMSLEQQATFIRTYGGEKYFALPE